jgi:hypothetical protein
MDNSQDHLITLHFAESQPIAIFGVVEATGLYLNAIVKGNVLQDRTYEYSIECVSGREFVIRAKLRHPLKGGEVEQGRAYAPLYLVFLAWYMAGANVEIEGPWKDSFPGRGALSHDTNLALLLQPLFQDGLPISERITYPSLETLAEIHRTLTHGAQWDHVKENDSFQNCFPAVSLDPEDSDNVRLCHRSGLNVDLILEQGMISSHIIDCVQAELDVRYISCQRITRCARTWWDAWIGHCPSTSLTPQRILVLAGEVAMHLISGDIWRYQLRHESTLARPLEIDFGDGINPTRSIESWLEFAKQFGEAGFVEVAIACCEQAIASATAMRSQSPEVVFQLPLGVSSRQLLDDAETEYLRWLDYQESLKAPLLPHDRWRDEVDCRSVQELTIVVGSKWRPVLDELIEAINNEHADSHDYHRKIGRIGEFNWNVEGEIGKLRYRRLFGRDLMDSKVPRKAMSMLGYNFREDVIPVQLDFDEIFTLTLGNAEFWGSVERRVLVSCSDPSLAYSL